MAYLQEWPFVFHGKISAKGLDNISLFKDDSGKALVTFKLPDLSYPKAGSIVTIKGHLSQQGHQSRTIYVTSYDVERIEDPDPPVEVPLEKLPRSSPTPMFIRTDGTVVEVYPDDVDASFTHVILSAQGHSVCVAAYNRDLPYTNLVQLVNARIRLSGIYVHMRDWRWFALPIIEFPSNVEIIRPAPKDPFDIEPLVDFNGQRISAEIRGTRRQTQGTVIALCQGNNVLIRFHGKQFLYANLSPGVQPPRVGQSVEVAGIVDTDGANLLIRNAIWRTNGRPDVAFENPKDMVAKDLFLNAKGERAIQYEHNGTCIRLAGEVLAVQSTGDFGPRLIVNSDNFTISVDASGCPSAAKNVSIGCKVAISGICLIDFDTWRHSTPFPHIRSIQLIVRKDSDIRILSRPSPLTTARLLVVIFILLFAIVIITVWNRLLKTLINRKSRELFKSQISRAESELRVNERTRLAAELHDDTVQGLTAVAYRISEAQSSLGDSEDETRDNLRIAAKMLKSCRTNLRRCLWDLRSDVLDDPDFGHAIVRTTENVAGDAAVRVRFSGRRSLLSDTVAHAILNILRELVANAVNHGHADEIKIAGECHQGALYVSVRDNGVGFNPENRPTQKDGHFGLNGIEERLAHLGGTLSIRSSTGRGTYVRISIAAITQQNGNSPS